MTAVEARYDTLGRIISPRFHQAYARYTTDDSRLDRSWMDEALCSGMDPEIWFPTSHHPGRRQRGAADHDIERARLICQQCVVARECHAYAMALSHPPAGIWAGVTESGRDKLRRQQRKT